MYELNDREVEITDYDFEMGEGVWVLEAVFMDTEEDLTDEQLEELSSKYQSELYQEAYEYAAARAYDDAKDLMKYGE